MLDAPSAPSRAPSGKGTSVKTSITHGLRDRLGVVLLGGAVVLTILALAGPALAQKKDDDDEDEKPKPAAKPSPSATPSPDVDDKKPVAEPEKGSQKESNADILVVPRKEFLKVRRVE